jgi:hypothetical protein
MRPWLLTTCLLWIIQTTWAQSIPSTGEILDRLHGGGVLMNFVMLEQPSVQREIQATPQQVSDAKQLADSLRGRLQGLSQLPKEEAAARVAEVRQTAIAGQQKILSAQQYARLREIGWQQAGPLIALGIPEVAQGVGLTMSQRVHLKELQEGMIQRVARMAPQQGGVGRIRSTLDALRELQASKQQADAQALALLTPEQQQSWSRLQGAPFQGEVSFGGGAGGLGGGNALGAGGLRGRLRNR